MPETLCRAYNAPPFTTGSRILIQHITGELAANPIARLGASHGYAIDGDSARLNAEILFDASRLCGQHWALQLWADDAVKIAELPLGLLPNDGSGCVRVDGLAAAFPPAGQQARTVTLQLVNDRDGVNDRAAYQQPLCVAQPRLNGTVCCSFGEQRITLAIAGIENPRSADNLSGTLALELWALDAPYGGGAWSGTPVASLVLGTLAGQGTWLDVEYSSHAAPLPETGTLTLMLREWTPAGYVTRDYRELARPGRTPAAAEETPAVAAAPVAPTIKAAEKSAEKAVEKAGSAPAAAGVSVNRAGAAEIGAIKGISGKLARAIVAGRPYRALDDLVKVKGMGPKLLERLRQFFTL